VHLQPTSTAVRHLAIEASRLVQEKRGIARYVRNVVREIAAQQPALRFTFFVSEPQDVDALTALLPQLHASLPERATVQHIDALPDTDADVVWYAWNFITVPALRATMVVTIHDLAPMLRLDHRWWKVLKRAKYRRRYARTLDRAHAVLTDSAFSRAEMTQHLGVDPNRVTITLLAADDLPISTTDDHAPLDAAGVTGPFFLYVGAQDSRKNLPTLYRAMERLWAEGVRVPLVQCGPSLCRDTKVLLGKAPWLHHLGFVSEAQLATLYRRATALVFPSRYEGFGLPVAEAMRAGTPVICAAGSSLSEVAGTAALLVPWDDIGGFAREMHRLVAHPEMRSELGALGVARAAQFSWARTAQETFGLFERTAWQRVDATSRASAALTARAEIAAPPRLPELTHG
jgi:glycosyltransferase involved in cell wall biosynthesis